MNMAEGRMDSNVAVKPSNRRRSPRRRPRSSVKVQCRKGAHGLGADLASDLLDIFDTGVRLTLKAAIDHGSEVEMIVSGYGMKAPIKRIGIVRWQLKLETGQFCA